MPERVDKNTDTDDSAIESTDPIERGELMTQTETTCTLINYGQKEMVDDMDKRPNRHTTNGNSDATDDIGETV